MKGESEELRSRIRELEAAARVLEPDLEEREQLRAELVATSERFLGALDSSPAFVEVADPALGLLDTPIGETGIDLDRALGVLEDQVLRPGGHPASGAHLAYLTGGGMYHAALADYLAAVCNKYAGIFFTGPGPVRMENQVVRWVADLVGYPATAAGSILSGGSLANLTAVVAARDAHELRGADYASAVVYLTSQTHHAVHKAVRIAGLAEAPIRQVALDERLRMRPDALAEIIAADRARGLRPWLVVANAGTTDAGAVDPLDALADVAEREGCWFHVDAAYGGFFLLTEDGRKVLRGIERSDSAVLDPHKSLFLPWGAGVVVARDVNTLTAAFAETGHYLQDAQDVAEVSPSDVSPELTKPFRALRMWLPLIHLGVAPFRAALEEKLLLARYFRHEVARLGFEVGPPPDLSVVTYRWAPPGTTPERADELTQKILDGVRRDGRVFLSSTRIDGRFTLRMAALAHRTHLATIDTALEVLGEQVAKL
ncbi:MAG: aminotransferase class V-fold PLP-dependent enzyme [Acidobacteria bacterium]|nr:aminotransferase class V-fold PLP-dependent enzyme [Acidobacteriota bacterium]